MWAPRITDVITEFTSPCCAVVLRSVGPAGKNSVDQHQNMLVLVTCKTSICCVLVVVYAVFPAGGSEHIPPNDSNNLIRGSTGARKPLVYVRKRDCGLGSCNPVGWTWIPLWVPSPRISPAITPEVLGVGIKHGPHRALSLGDLFASFNIKLRQHFYNLLFAKIEEQNPNRSEVLIYFKKLSSYFFFISLVLRKTFI